MTSTKSANISRTYLAMVAVAFATFIVADRAQASVEITSSPTRHMNCSSGVCSPTDKNANLNVDDLANMLATSDVKVVTGNGAVTITVGSAITWTSTTRLTLDANLNVSFRAQMEVAGPGGLTIITNDGGTGGDLLFFDGNSVDFWDTTSSLVVNGNTYTLVDTLPALVAAAKSNPSGFYALSKSYNAIKLKVYKGAPIKTFSGIFEGLGHTISNLAINYSTNDLKHAKPIGLFSISSGVIRDIGLLSANVVSTVNGAILVGENDGSVIQAYTDGTVSASNYSAGGLTSYNTGTISNSSSSAQVTGYFAVGGLVGDNSGTIASSHATGAVQISQSGEPYIGGLVGVNGAQGQTATITNCYSTGTVSGSYGGGSGGLVGNNGGLITLSHSDSNLTNSGAGFAGGLVGNNTYLGVVSLSYADGAVMEGGGGLMGQNGGVITQSYATGSVAADFAGGLVEVNYATISQAYSTGAVNAFYGDNDKGGFAGNDSPQEGAKISTSYWDTDTSGVTDLSKGAGNIPYDAGITGLTSAQLSSGLPSGFDPSVWGENSTINNGLPYLLANPPSQTTKAKKVRRLSH